jgi:hypothetical protein
MKAHSLEDLRAVFGPPYFFSGENAILKLPVFAFSASDFS